MRRPYGYDCKEFSDLLGPLRQFLISRVGRKWDDVYSEIRERLNPNSTAQIHILSHVDDMVEPHVWIDESGQPHSKPHARWASLRGGEMYVHPLTGMLCRLPEGRAAWKRRKQADQDKKVIGDKELRRIDGIWYWVAETSEMVLIHDGNTERYVVQNRLAKRQVNRRDLRRHGLSN